MSHANDTTVPVLAKSNCRTARFQSRVCDDAPCEGGPASAALVHYSPDRKAPAFSRYQRLFAPGRAAEGIMLANCWTHARRQFYEIAEFGKLSVAIKTVRQIDEVFDMECGINGPSPDKRIAMRRTGSRPLTEIPKT